MAYIGKNPSDTFSGVASKDSFTGDGSTVIFDISTDIPQGGDNDIFVYVDNVRQEPGVSKAYTTGQDGSGNYRRITFTTAPDSGAEIYVLNPGRIEALQVTGDNTVSATKIQSSAVTTVKINDGAVTTAKLGSAAVTNTNLDTSIITGFTELAEEAAAGDFLIIYDTSTGTLKKIQRSNITLQAPTVSSISPTNVDSKDSATTTTFTVTGTGFTTGTTAKLRNNSGADISFNTVTRDSATQLTCVLNNGLITGDGITNEPYDIVVTVGNGLIGILENQINVDQRPVFVTAAGSLGTVANTDRSTATFTIQATDPESAGAVRFDLVGGSLPTGSSLNSSTGVISTFDEVGSDTTSTFTVQASDVDSNVSFREFSITISAPISQSFTTSGTFSVPVGVTTVNVLVVAGGGGGGNFGGGGAGGLIYRPGFPVTPGGTVSVTVGCGGVSSGVNPGPVSAPGQDSVFGTLTAKGGGGGGRSQCTPHPSPNTNIGNGASGGSGGGGGHPGSPGVGACGPGGGGVGGSATQPTQPGDSGTYGFGNSGGQGGNSLPAGSPGYGGGGGGGAGAAGQSAGGQNPAAGLSSGGGIGKTYSISGTSVYYSGGGGGAYNGQGGQGGGGNASPNCAPYPAQPGTANRGGGGGSTYNGTPQGQGGKGIVIVAY